MFTNAQYMYGDSDGLYTCEKDVMRYLVFKRNHSVFGMNGKRYYFIYNNKLKESLKKMPLSLRLSSMFRRK